MKKLTTYRYWFCNDFGEGDAFFEKVSGKLKLIHWWDGNDAIWRGEYMNPLMKHLGITVSNVTGKDAEIAEKLIRKEIEY